MIFILDKRSHQEILEISRKYSKNRFSLSIFNSVHEMPGEDRWPPPKGAGAPKNISLT
jgi:hypothetical protein